MANKKNNKQRQQKIAAKRLAKKLPNILMNLTEEQAKQLASVLHEAYYEEVDVYDDDWLQGVTYGRQNTARYILKDLGLVD